MNTRRPPNGDTAFTPQLNMLFFIPAGSANPSLAQPFLPPLSPSPRTPPHSGPFHPASQDLRPPGPVPPDVAPFRLAGAADGQPPLSSFSAIGVGKGEESKSRAYAHLATDDTPSATHVTNWIEDNPRMVWSSSSRRQCVVSACKLRGAEFGAEMGVRMAGSAGGNDAGEKDGDMANSTVEGRGDGGQKAKEALSGVATTAELPNVVGAGGFADFVPLLGAIIGRYLSA